MLLKSLWIALSTYSVLPVPQFEWTKRNMEYAICFFPVVGFLCGGALALWNWLCTALKVSSILFAVVATCLPILLTGGIHMDGFMDTVDALASHQPRERKLEILKDPHCGAFAIFYCVVYLLLCFGLYYEVFSLGLAYALCPAFVLSRALSALCAVTLPNARKAGMLCSFTGGVHRRTAVAAVGITSVCAGLVLLLLSPVPGCVCLLFCAAALIWYRRMALRQFGGGTGDTAGFFLQTCELSALLGLWLGGLV